MDLAGALTGTLATAVVIYGLVTAGSQGWGATTTLIPLAVGLVLVGFVAVERAIREPLVPVGCSPGGRCWPASWSCWPTA